jgi:hypothetical protein
MVLAVADVEILENVVLQDRGRQAGRQPPTIQVILEQGKGHRLERNSLPESGMPECSKDGPLSEIDIIQQIEEIGPFDFSDIFRGL